MGVSDVAEDKQGAVARDGGYKNSMGIEAIAIFAVVSFIARIATDIAIRVRNGRRRRSTLEEAPQLDMNRLAYLALTMIKGSTQLYHDSAADPKWHPQHLRGARLHQAAARGRQ